MFLQDGAVGQLAPVHSGGGRRFESYSCYKVNQKRLFFKKQPKMVDKCRISVMVAFDPSKVTVTVRICYSAQRCSRYESRINPDRNHGILLSLPPNRKLDMLFRVFVSSHVIYGNRNVWGISSVG